MGEVPLYSEYISQATFFTRSAVAAVGSQIVVAGGAGPINAQNATANDKSLSEVSPAPIDFLQKFDRFFTETCGMCTAKPENLFLGVRGYINAQNVTANDKSLSEVPPLPSKNGTT